VVVSSEFSFHFAAAMTATATLLHVMHGPVFVALANPKSEEIAHFKEILDKDQIVDPSVPI
jgi:hypothetical protein